MTNKAVQGQAVYAHYIAVFDQHQTLLGDALKLPTPARMELQLIGNKVGYQLFMPQDVVIPISDARIVGVSFFDKDKQFLCGFSIPGDPRLRQKNQEFIVRSRYIILGPKKSVGAKEKK